MKTILSPLKHEDFGLIYTIMEQSFPPVERRTFENAQKLLSNPRYHIWVNKQNKTTITGFLASWDFDEFRFVEHFAVDKTVRGAGIGSAMMKDYLNLSQTPVIIEVEQPNTDTSKRRIHFYQRLGFNLTQFGYIQPALQNSTSEVYLRIMSYPSNITEHQFKQFQNKIFLQAYGRTL